MQAGNSRAASPLTPAFSKKVFLGGLPPDIDESQLSSCFAVFGKHRVDWPHKNDSIYQFPPQGYAFVIFDKTSSVVSLLSACAYADQKFIITVSSLSIKNKQVQVRPWQLSDCFYIHSPSPPLDHRLTIFVGGVPRPTTSKQLASLLDVNFGCVLQVTIDVDSSLLYPRGSAKVRFAYRHSYIAAVEKRFLRFSNSSHQKHMEIKPFVVDDANCDVCGDSESKFCGAIKCLSYFCASCWTLTHAKLAHEPLVVETKRRKSRRPARTQSSPTTSSSLESSTTENQSDNQSWTSHNFSDRNLISSFADLELQTVF